MTRRRNQNAGRKPKYPWAEWLGRKGTRRKLTRKDFPECLPHSFSVQLRQAAKRLGIAVSVYIKEEEDGQVIVTLENKGAA